MYILDQENKLQRKKFFSLLLHSLNTLYLLKKESCDISYIYKISKTLQLLFYHQHYTWLPKAQIFFLKISIFITNKNCKENRAQPGSNRWPLNLQSNALPLSYAIHIRHVHVLFFQDLWMDLVCVSTDIEFHFPIHFWNKCLSWPIYFSKMKENSLMFISEKERKNCRGHT